MDTALVLLCNLVVGDANGEIEAVPEEHWAAVAQK